VKGARNEAPRGFPKLDKVDEKLIELLKYENVVAPRYADIARKMEMSASTIRDRIKRLEKSGILEGYSASVDRAKFGRGIRMLRLVRFKAAPNEVFKNYLAWGKAYPKWLGHIVQIIFTTGHYDCALVYDFADMQEYHQFERELMSFMRDTIEVEDLGVVFTAADERRPRRTPEEFEKVIKRLMVKPPKGKSK